MKLFNATPRNRCVCLRLALCIAAVSCITHAQSPRPNAPWPPPSGPLRVVIDTDAANEIDDQYALALALGFPERLRIEGLVAAHYGDRGGPAGVATSYEEIERVLEKAGMKGRFALKRGSPPYTYRQAPPTSEGVQFIIDRAMQATPADPLWLIVLGPATDAAAALQLAPEIADRLVVFWHGRTEWPVRCWNFNAYNDMKAASLLFELPARFVLFDTGADITMDMSEARRCIADQGPLGRYLYDIRAQSPRWSRPDKGLFDLGDIAALVDPNLVRAERTAAPTVEPDLRYNFTKTHGQIVRIHDIARDETLSLLVTALTRVRPKP